MTRISVSVSRAGVEQRVEREPTIHERSAARVRELLDRAEEPGHRAREARRHYFMRWGCHLALLWAVGCGIEQPLNEEVDAPAWSGAAADLAVEDWAGRTGSVTELPAIRWFLPDEDGCLVYESTPSCALGAFVTDLWEEPEIHLLVRGLASDSSLAHELLHWSLYSLGEGTNGAHDRPEWDDVVDVEDALRAAGM